MTDEQNDETAFQVLWLNGVDPVTAHEASRIKPPGFLTLLAIVVVILSLVASLGR